jgi:hypothetical protein
VTAVGAAASVINSPTVPGPATIASGSAWIVAPSAK